jgi:hypothetical protein
MMVEAIVKEIFLAVGRFFINPLVYIALLSAICLGYVRVKRERKFFHIRILKGWTEFFSVFRTGFFLSVILSVVTIAAGLVVNMQYLITVSLVTILFLIFFNYHLLSAVVTFGLSYGILLLMDWQNFSVEVPFFELTGIPFNDASIVPVVLIIGLLLIVEGIVIHTKGAKLASPIKEKTNRGLKSIAYFTKSITIVPVFFLIPGDVIDGFAPWWPLFTLGNEQFGIVLFPVVIGFQQLTRRMLPIDFYPKMGKHVWLLGIAVVLAGVGAYYIPLIGLITLGAAIIIRFVLSIGYKLTERKDLYAVAPNHDGAMIAAVLPGSPAEKMGLQPGEVIKRINGKQVYTEREVYEALQINAAHCKLDVLDVQKEIRLTQYVVHSEDHHQIGLIIV